MYIGRKLDIADINIRVQGNRLYYTLHICMSMYIYPALIQYM